MRVFFWYYVAPAISIIAGSYLWEAINVTIADKEWRDRQKKKAHDYFTWA